MSLFRRVRKLSCSPTGIVVLSFLVSRAIYMCVVHVHFHSAPITCYYQYLDPLLLRTDLLRSLFYLHQQPPLFNLFLGIVLKLFPEHWPRAFRAIYLVMGLGFSIAQFRLMEEMAVSRGISLTFAVISTVMPTTLLYENWLFYAYPVAFLLCLSALSLCLFLKHHRMRHAVFYFSLMAIIILTRTSYQLSWFLFFLLVLVWQCKPQRTLILKAASVPLLIVLVFAVKQYLLFGTTAAGTIYVGENLAGRIQQRIPQDMQVALIRDRLVPAWFFVHYHSGLEAYAGLLPETPPTGIPALDRPSNSTYFINFNHRDFLPITAGYTDGFINVTLRNPGFYLESLYDMTRQYFEPSGEDHVMRLTYVSPFMKKLLACFNFMICGQPAPHQKAYCLILGLPLIIGFGLVESLRGLRGKLAGNEAYYLTTFYMVVTTCYLSVLAVAVGWGEAARSRFDVNSFYMVIFGVMLSRGARFVFNRQGKRS